MTEKLNLKKTRRNTKKPSKKSILQRNLLACTAGMAIFISLLLPWLGETKGLQQIWQTKGARKIVEHLYYPQQDSLIFFGHLALILAFIMIVSVEYWRNKAGKFSALVYMILSAIIVTTLTYNYATELSSFKSGMWTAISGALLLGLSGSTMFYVKRSPTRIKKKPAS